MSDAHAHLTNLHVSYNLIFFWANSGPLSGYMVQRFGFRTTTIIGAIIGAAGVVSSAFVSSLPMAYFTFGFLGGSGLGISYIPSISIVGFYFTDCRPIAFALASSGCGIGKLIAPYILQYCEDVYGWRGAICIIGAISLNVCVCGTVFRKPETRQTGSDIDQETSSSQGSETNDSETKELTSRNCKVGLCADLSMLREAKFLCLCANNFLYCVGYATAMVHLPAYAQTLGIDEHRRALFFSMFGPASIVGKLFFGLVGQIKGVKHILVYTLVFFIIGVELIFSPLYLATFVDFLIFSVTFGFFMSTFGATLPSIVVELYDVASLSSAYGYLQLFDMAGFLLGPPVAGWMYDWTSYYPTSIYFGGASIIVSTFFVAPMLFCERKKTHATIANMPSEIPQILSVKEAQDVTTKLLYIHVDEVLNRNPSHSPGMAA